MKTVQLRPREHYRLIEGHQWIFRNELQQATDAEPGEVVMVLTNDGRELGIGFYHPTSRISVRMAGAPSETVNTEYFEQRIRRALRLRQHYMPEAQAYRVVFGEADMLGGLIVDRFADTLVLQTFSAGMDMRLSMIVQALLHVLPNTTGIIERNTMATRRKEGLPLREGVLYGDVPNTVKFTENNIVLEASVHTGQKTGYFLDQSVNRRWVQDHSRGLRVLDAFCNVGGFALHAASGGATSVLGVDSSAIAIEQAQRHARMNALDTVQFLQANVFDVLREHAQQGITWDMIILDPPSFAKSRDARSGARAGYAELNRSALKLLRSGGQLITSSCTQLVPEYELMDIVYAEAARLRIPLRLVHRGVQAPDHPVLLAMPETSYLKFLVFDVL